MYIVASCNWSLQISWSAWYVAWMYLNAVTMNAVTHESLPYSIMVRAVTSLCSILRNSIIKAAFAALLGKKERHVEISGIKQNRYTAHNKEIALRKALVKDHGTY